MEHVPTLYEGKAFHSYTELTRFMAEYELHHQQKFWKRSSRKITSTANIKRQINGALVYYEISYFCVHGGLKFKSRSQGVRKSITFRLGAPCAAYIRIRAAPDGQTLIVKAFSEDHNHISDQNRWTVAQIEALIEEYKKYPVLYDTTHEKHSNAELKNACLLGIVEELQGVRRGVTEEDVVSQWNNLVLKYVQVLHMQDNDNSGYIEERKLWYLQKLQFLEEHLGPTDAPLEVDEDPEQIKFFEPEITTEWENSGLDPLASTSLRIKEELEDVPSKRPKDRLEPEGVRRRDDNEVLAEAIAAQLKRSAAESHEVREKDHRDIFAEFVAAQLKRITDEEVRQDTILEIHKVLHQALKKK